MPAQLKTASDKAKQLAGELKLARADAEEEAERLQEAIEAARTEGEQAVAERLLPDGVYGSQGWPGCQCRSQA